ncbi:uncharacterized protein [Antedon mediterranea]|uniref:uncharacterized protein isoform X2 n=1 Tax=Antedon mediterranea TaxID=105859 RepID=UPI003AF5362E
MSWDLILILGLYLLSKATCEEEPWPRLVWTELRLKDSTAKLQSLPADPNDYISSSSISTRYYYTNKPAHWIAVTNDFEERTVFWSDSGQKRIMKGGLGDAATASSIYQGTSSSVEGIAVDWLAKTLYWVDETYNWIVVTDYYASNIAILIDTGLSKPRGIATHPHKGYLFWTDWGSGDQKVERSTLAGDDRVVLVDDDLFFPNGLTIDFATDRLYWTDVNVAFSKIKSTDLNGNNLTTIIEIASSTAHFFDLTVFQNYLFVTDWRNYLRCVNIKEKSHYFALNLGSRPYGIMVFGNENQPNGTSPCASKPCNQICVTDPGPDGYKCLCKEGYEFFDGKCKKREIGLSSPQIIFSKSNSLCGIPGNFPDLPLPADFSAPCFLQNQTHIVALQLDSEEKLLFYSDAELRRVMSVRLTHGSNTNTIMGGVGSVEGIAVDWISKNLYMTDYAMNRIVVSRYEGTSRKILIDTDVISPRSIAIDPRESAKFLFWTEFGEPAQIERSFLDGSHRQVIVSKPLVSPNGLTIDFASKRLFFGDRSSSKIESVDYDGLNRKLVFAKPAAHFFDMDIYQDYLLFTEWNENTGVHAIEFESGREQKSLLHDGIAYGIKTYSPSRQPTDATDYMGPSCLDENGGCQHLCLPSSDAQGYTCDCSTGYRIHTDGKTCVTDIMDDNFILLADTYLHAIFQVSLGGATNGYTALPLGMMSNSVAIDFDPVDKMVYWTDVDSGSINRAKLDGTMREIVARRGVESADGIAVDSVSRLLFWTDSTKKTIEVSQLNGLDRKTIIDTDVDKPRAIAADSVNGVIYWTDWGNEPKIERANMDGTNRTVLVNSGLVWPNGLELDFQSNRLYWCDGKMSKIESINFNGQDRQPLIDLGSSKENHLFGLTSDENNIYWSNWAAGMVMTVKKTDIDTNGTSFGFKGFTKINDISLYNSRLTRQGTTACSVQNGNCSNLCLPLPGEDRTCACANGIDLTPENDNICDGAVRCPETFENGNVYNCDRFPYDSCQVDCDIGYDILIPEIDCKPNGEWNISLNDPCQIVKCPVPILHPNVYIADCLPPYEYNTSCTFKCGTGTSQTSGNATQTCGVSGWEGDPLTCQVVHCPPLNPPANGAYSPSACSLQSVQFNQICGLGCSSGYDLSGSRTHLCLEDGTWSSAFEDNKCIDVETPTFGNTCPQNITVITPHGKDTMKVTWQVPIATDNSNDVNVTSDATPPITLGEGERLITYTAIDASENKATCTFGVIVEVRRCKTLLAPMHGHLGGVNCGNHLGTSCEIVCNEGYYMVGGDSNRTCSLQNGQPIWTGQQPSCSNVICPEVEAPQHVLKAACSAPYILHTECQYICQKGYNKVSGSDRQTCGISGEWTGSLIQCEIQTCRAIPAFAHGMIIPANCTNAGGRYNDECTFSCVENYELQGEAVHVCGASGQWSNMDDEHVCQDPTAPKLGQCPDNINVVANRNETTAEALWVIPDSFDENGERLNVTSSKPNGERLSEGNHTIVLSATDSKGKNSSCRFIVEVTVHRCPEHPPFEHGLMIGQCNNHYGTSCQFACETGFLLTGSRIRTCELFDGNNNIFDWTGDMPGCGANLCPMFPSPENGLIQGCDASQPQPYQTQCQVQCSEGYRQTSGDNLRVCLDNGTWDGIPLDCQGVACPGVSIEGVSVYPPSCSNGAVYRDECHFGCNQGYALRGALSQYCSASGQWTQNDNDTFCEDITPPVFTDCPDELPFQADECQRQALVDFSDPKAEDNSGQVVVSALTILFEGLPTYLPDGEFKFNYIAEDDARNIARCSFKVKVIVTQCPDLPITNSLDINTSCNNLYGSIAKFRCTRAYSTLEGQSNVTCLSTGEWSDSTPHCNEVMCNPLRNQDYGKVMPFVYPYSCSARRHPVGKQCHIRCPFGYQSRDGTTSVRCLPNGQWTSLPDSLCVDITPPRFISCPSAITKYLSPRKSTVKVTWNKPRPFDTSGVFNLTSPDVEQPLQLGPGITRLNYVATDGSGNEAHCIFTITVIDAQKPTVKGCPEVQALKSDTLPIEFKWHHSPVFADNVNVTDITYSRQKGDLVYEWGEYSVDITATDDNNNAATCTMLVEAVPTDPCKTLDAPKNGQMNCKAHHCTATCRDGYVFLDGQTRHKYNCNTVLGRWNHGNPTDPQPFAASCSKVIPGNEIRLERQDALVFSHPTPIDCRNTSASRQTQIQNLLDSSKFITFCQSHEDIQCSFKDISSLCANNRVKRTTLAILSNEVGVMFTYVATSSNADLLDQMLRAINISINDLWPESKAYLDINGDRVTLAPSISEKGTVSSVCPKGQSAANKKCVQCSPGTFYDIHFERCLPCQVGTYQDKEGQLACVPCPRGTSTPGSSAFSLDSCTRSCRPGNYSYLGIEPCNKCAVGTYQTRYNSRFCTRCPKGVETHDEGSSSIRECIGYETYSTASPSEIPTGSIKPTKGQMTTQAMTTASSNDSEVATLKDSREFSIIIVVVCVAVAFFVIVVIAICVVKRRRKKGTFKPHRLNDDSQPVSNMFQELGEMQTLCFENQTYSADNDKNIEDDFGYSMLENDNTSIGKPLTSFKVDENDDLLATL